MGPSITVQCLYLSPIFNTIVVFLLEHDLQQVVLPFLNAEQLISEMYPHLH